MSATGKPPQECHFIAAKHTVVQEWTGKEWIVVDSTKAFGRSYRPLDPQTSPGEYVGERVVTPCD